MVEIVLKLIDSLPKIAANWKTFILLVGTGIFAGFTGFPLWLLYRNEEDFVNLFISLSQRPTTVNPYPREALVVIRSHLEALIQDSGANRVIFGVVHDFNRVILVESFPPLESPLPLGFQTVYLKTSDYETIYNSLRLNSCIYLSKEDAGPYFSKELEISNSSFYLACPSTGDWFIAAYFEEDTRENQLRVEATIEELEAFLETSNLYSPPF